MGKPHSLQTFHLGDHRSPAEKFAALGPIAARHGQFAKGAVLPQTRVQVCPRVKMADLPAGHIPARLYEKNMEQNQSIPSCCRHPENHEIEACKSHPEEPAPDIYIFHCKCGRQHRVMCVGNDSRPAWSA